MFYLIPAASSKLIEPLVTLVLKAEKALLMEVNNKYKLFINTRSKQIDESLENSYL